MALLISVKEQSVLSGRNLLEHTEHIAEIEVVVVVRGQEGRVGKTVANAPVYANGVPSRSKSDKSSLW